MMFHKISETTTIDLKKDISNKMQFFEEFNTALSLSHTKIQQRDAGLDG